MRCFRQKLRKFPPSTTVDSVAASECLRRYKSRRLPATATIVKVVGAPRKLTAAIAFVTSGVARTCNHVPALASSAASGVLRAIASAITRNKPAATEKTIKVGPGPSSRMFGPQCKLCIVVAAGQCNYDFAIDVPLLVNGYGTCVESLDEHDAIIISVSGLPAIHKQRVGISPTASELMH